MAKVSELQENLEKKNIKFDDIVDNDTKGMKNKLLFLWALIGPGFLAAIGDNDAGGLISYSVTGMKFGISLFIPLSICLVIITYTVQEMSMRLSVVTQTGFTSLIKKYYGNSWIKYHITTICMENILMLTTEFIGMSAGLVVLGLPMWVSVLISLVLVLSVITMAGYWTKERLTLFIGFFNIVFIIIAFMTHPSIKNIAYTFIAWNYPKESQNLFWYIVAIIGNAVAP
ncbi:divalent metal cation transporter, partial [Clostridium tyrobutyricum]